MFYSCDVIEPLNSIINVNECIDMKGMTLKDRQQ